MKTDPVIQYYKACDALAKAFVKTYYCGEETSIEDMEGDYFWVVNNFGGVLIVNDESWNMDDIVTALVHEIPENILFAWYSDSLDQAMESKGAEGFLQSFKDMFDLVEVQTGVSERERFVKEYEAAHPINLLNYYKSTQRN